MGARCYTFINPTYRRPNQVDGYMVGEHDAYLATDYDSLLSAAREAEKALTALSVENEGQSERCFCPTDWADRHADHLPSCNFGRAALSRLREHLAGTTKPTKEG